MRSFVAGLAVFLAFLTGTLALGSHVVHAVVLDPARAGEVVDYALHQPGLRRDVLGRTVPGYGRLPLRLRADVDAVAGSAAVARATRQIALDEQGRVVLEPLQAALIRLLRPAHPALASRIAAAQSRVAVPGRYADRYDAARDDSSTLALRAALITAGLLVMALLVTPSRRRTVRSIGIGAVLAALVVGLLHWALPTAIAAASSGPLVEAVVAVVRAERTDVLWRLAPVAGAGLLVVVATALTPRSRRASPIGRLTTSPDSDRHT